MDYADKINIDKYKVSTERLKKICMTDDELNFCGSSKEVNFPKGVIGQDRAVKAMEFGLSMNAAGYNIFILGH